MSAGNPGPAPGTPISVDDACHRLVIGDHADANPDHPAGMIDGLCQLLRDGTIGASIAPDGTLLFERLR